MVRIIKSMREIFVSVTYGPSPNRLYAGLHVEVRIG
jgi:hypothetical protein